LWVRPQVPGRSNDKNPSRSTREAPPPCSFPVWKFFLSSGGGLASARPEYLPGKLPCHAPRRKQGDKGVQRNTDGTGGIREALRRGEGPVRGKRTGPLFRCALFAHAVRDVGWSRGSFNESILRPGSISVPHFPHSSWSGLAMRSGT
jgi:hypothetical protein